MTAWLIVLVTALTLGVVIGALLYGLCVPRSVLDDLRDDDADEDDLPRTPLYWLGINRWDWRR